MPTGSDNNALRKPDPNRASSVRFLDGRMVIALEDGRELSVLLKHYPTLRDASAKEREDCDLFGNGKAIHWEALDLDLSVDALLQGIPEKFPAPPSTAPPRLKATSVASSRRGKPRRVG